MSEKERIIMKRFKGFTLTELMVALAVIGILVAVVTPAIMKTRPNKNKMMVKKTFYSVEQIVSSLINDEGLYTPPDNDECVDSSTCRYGFANTDKATYEGEDYEGNYKFAALLKEYLNVKNNAKEDGSFTDDTWKCDDNAKDDIGPEGNNFCAVFFTSDGVEWNLTGTKEAWQEAKKVGSFDDNTEDESEQYVCKDSVAKSDGAKCGTIKIDVDTSNQAHTECTKDNEDCDTYDIQILANGKLRVNPYHEVAVRYATINTSIKDTDN